MYLHSNINTFTVIYWWINMAIWMMLLCMGVWNYHWMMLHTQEDFTIFINMSMYFLFKSLLLLISMLWHRQAIFESKGDKLSSSAEGRIRTHQGLRHQIASRLNAHWQTDWASEDQAKNLNSTARQSLCVASCVTETSSSIKFKFKKTLLHPVHIVYITHNRNQTYYINSIKSEQRYPW